MQMRKTGGYVLAVLVLHVVPLGGASAMNEMGFGPFRVDFLLHAAVFLPWMFLPGITPAGAAAGWRFQKWAGWFLLGLILAVGAETIRLGVSYRAFNPMDAVFNAGGVVVGAIGVTGWKVLRLTIDSTEKAGR